MTERHCYLGDGRQRFFATYHEPREQRGRPAVVLAPPFGWDELATHRALRDWAEALSAHNHPVLRFDLPGTGDSAGGPADPDLVTAWQAAVERAAEHVRGAAGVSTVVGIGIGLGGMLVYEAAARGHIDHVVLWTTPSRGRTLIRELSAFASLETAQIVEAGSPEPPPQPAQILAPGGFVLAPETATALSAMTLSTQPLAPTARALLLDRDGIKPDAGLRAAIAAAGADLTTASGKGFSRMLAAPDRSRTPVEVFATVQTWLDQLPEAAVRTASAQEASDASDVLRLDGLRERPLLVPTSTGRLFGITAVPETDAAPLTAIFLNAGAVRRIGPHRLWVDTARRWARQGVRSFRFDLGGIGDSDGDAQSLAEVAEFYDPRFTAQVRAGLDELERQGVGDRFVVVGLCSGSSWAFLAALEDPRIAFAFMLNPRILYWDAALDAARNLRRTHLLLKPAICKRLLQGEVSARRFGAFLSWLVQTPIRVIGRLQATKSDGSPIVERVASAFDQLRLQGTELRFLFCDGEPLHEEMRRDGLLSQRSRWPNIAVSILPGRDHTLRPLWMHEHVDAALDAALEAALASVAEESPERRAPSGYGRRVA